MKLKAVVLSAMLLPAVFSIRGEQVDETQEVAEEVKLPYTAEQADSCVAAFATIMAEYTRPELQRQFAGDTAAVSEFAAGVAHAFRIRDAHAPYYFGVRSGLAMIERVEGMQQMGYPITPQAFVPQLEAALKGDAMGFDGKTADAYLRHFMDLLYPAPEPLSEESQTAFLSSQKSREGVDALPSGLLFEIITEGEGESPSLTDKVKVTYKGALADGTVFDTTEKPITLPVSGVVPGFSEGLRLMKPGGTYRLFIPASLGYGDKGAGGVIPPGAALDFTVTLLEIEK